MNTFKIMDILFVSIFRFKRQSLNRTKDIICKIFIQSNSLRASILKIMRSILTKGQPLKICIRC